MSELGQFKPYLFPYDTLGLWEKRHSHHSQAEPAPDAPDPREVAYIGVMSAAYPRSAGVSFTPVESGAELFSLVPERYMYIGSQIAARHTVVGKVAIPLEWSCYHASISGLAHGMIGVLVAFLLSELDEGMLPLTGTHGGAGKNTSLVREGLMPVVWEKPDEVYELLCRLFGEIHEAYYGDYAGKYTERIPGILTRNKLIAAVLSESLSEEGKQALQILLNLGGELDRNWVDGLRELGAQVMLHDKGMFMGDTLPFWLLAIQEEFEFACRREVASHLWVQEREKA